jgi:hypothetical protein
MAKKNNNLSKSRHKKILQSLRIQKLEERMKLNIKKRKHNKQTKKNG